MTGLVGTLLRRLPRKIQQFFFYNLFSAEVHEWSSWSEQSFDQVLGSQDYFLRLV